MNSETMAAALAELRGQALAAIEGGSPLPSPVPAAYVVLYDGGDRARWERLAGGSQRLYGSLRAVCVARTPSGVRATRNGVRRALTDHTLPGLSGPLAETDCGPILPSGVEGDERMSSTLVYSTHADRKD